MFPNKSTALNAQRGDSSINHGNGVMMLNLIGGATFEVPLNKFSFAAFVDTSSEEVNNNENVRNLNIQKRFIENISSRTPLLQHIMALTAIDLNMQSELPGLCFKGLSPSEALISDSQVGVLHMNDHSYGLFCQSLLKGYNGVMDLQGDWIDDFKIVMETSEEDKSLSSNLANSIRANSKTLIRSELDRYRVDASNISEVIKRDMDVLSSSNHISLASIMDPKVFQILKNGSANSVQLILEKFINPISHELVVFPILVDLLSRSGSSCMFRPSGHLWVNNILNYQGLNTLCILAGLFESIDPSINKFYESAIESCTINSSRMLIASKGSILDEIVFSAVDDSFDKWLSDAIGDVIKSKLLNMLSGNPAISQLSQLFLGK